MSLIALRQAVRLGFVINAEKILKTLRGAKADIAIERAYLQLLKFEKPHIPLVASSDLGAVRLLVLNAAQLNRARDPLRALALLSGAKPQDTVCLVDVLFEIARVYSWLGNEKLAAENLTQVLALDVEKQIRFLALYRLGSLYAEVERLELAQRYLGLAQACCKGMEQSVYYTQFQECSARVDMALGGEAVAQRNWLQKNHAQLAPYLQFRSTALSIEAALVEKNISKAEALMQGLNVAGFEAQMRNVLFARVDLLKKQPLPAIEKLKAARDWFADEDLAPRFIQAKLLLAQAFAMNNMKDAAALELDQARGYCASRGLMLQQEKVERVFAELGLTLNPIVESKRKSAEGAWKDAEAYVLIKRLGEGGQANVYLAHDNARGRSVAYKKLKSADLESLAREVRLANAAQVSGVAKILACGNAADGALYMVQEFVEGKSLRKLLDAKQAKFDHALQLQEILQALHRVGIVHGDVKPENVMVNEQGHVTLVDFGLAQSGNQKSLGATPLYATPKFAWRNRSAKWRDEFALGLVMMECCGAKVVERKPGVADLFQVAAVLRDEMKPIDAATRILILKLLRPF